MSLPKKTILVVEDDVYIRDTVVEILQSEGYNVLSAENGQVGLDRLRGTVESVQLILLDLTMPVKDGFAFRAEQEMDPNLARIPVVVMTADSHAQVKQLKIGAKDHIPKPFDINAFLEVVRKAIV